MVLEHATYNNALACKHIAATLLLALFNSHLQTISTQTFHDRAVCVVMEIGYYALGNDLAHALYLKQLLQRCVHERVDVAKMSGNKTGRGLSHKTYAEGKDHSLKRHLL